MVDRDIASSQVPSAAPLGPSRPCFPLSRSRPRCRSKLCGYALRSICPLLALMLSTIGRLPPRLLDGYHTGIAGVYHYFVDGAALSFSILVAHTLEYPIPQKRPFAKKKMAKVEFIFFLAQSHLPGSTNSALCKNLTPPLEMRGLLLDPADGVRRQQPGAVARKISVNENPGTNNLAGNLSTHTRAALGQPPREQYRASKAAKQLGAF